MSGKIRHWKHGWIPLDGMDGMVGGKSPNNAHGRSTKKVKSDLTGAQSRAAEMSELVPGIGHPQPHYQPPSQDLPGHFPGGFDLNTHQSERLVNHLRSVHEGTPTRDESAVAAGEPQRALGGGPPERVSKNMSHMITELVPGLKDGFGALPSTNARKPLDVPYDGGLTFDGPSADILIRHLRNAKTGTTSLYATRRAAGLPVR